MDEHGQGGAFEFTTNHGAVLAAIDDSVAWKARVETLASGEDDAYSLQRLFEGVRPFNMVADICHSVARIPRRRKAIVYVGQGPTGLLLTDHRGLAQRGSKP